eukprot:TRINITY_DN2876_c0_g1_i1.p1 TRINITY_DN2876_c0_g1~~TRINITY_DN2876_c0_g1_i1.p1  ORF type:complete len:707 (+),score=124.45 TRINITY_DN2876_c0_g1_i1:380-2500(+)
MPRRDKPRIRGETAADVVALTECDDWYAEWERVQAAGDAWGGRGRGGRGIQRNTAQPHDVHIEGVTLAFQGHTLLQRTVLKLASNHRYGLIGRNGVGKTTLMRRIATGTIPGWPHHISTYLVRQEGVVRDGNDAGMTVMETVLDSDIYRADLLEEEAELLQALEGDKETTTLTENSSGNAGAHATDIAALVERLSEVHLELDAIDADSAGARAASILSGMGFDAGAQERPAAQLSGGWRKRLALACALFAKADVLLLDEPTSHLDLEAITWLQWYLTTQMKDTTLLVVSHDMAFLDAVCTDIIHMKLCQLQYHPGGLKAFERYTEEQQTHLARAEATITRQRAHMEASIASMEQAAARSKDHKKLTQVSSRRLKLEKHGMEKDEHGHRFNAQTQFSRTGSAIRLGAVRESASLGTRRSLEMAVEKEARFCFPPQLTGAKSPTTTSSTGIAMVQLKDVTFGWAGSRDPLFEHVNLDIAPGSRIVILAPNGRGKTTLMALIRSAAADVATAFGAAGQQGGAPVASTPSSALPHELLVPTSGEITVLRRVRVAMLTQHDPDQLQLGQWGEMSPLQFMQRAYPGIGDLELRGRLGSFGVGGDLALQPCSSLSGGQRARVILARLMYTYPDLLLLDEPSNHLDRDAIAGLKRELKSYTGAVMFASHDQAFVADLANELWVLRKRHIARWEEGFGAYIDRLQKLAARKHAQR